MKKDLIEYTGELTSDLKFKLMLIKREIRKSPFYIKSKMTEGLLDIMQSQPMPTYIKRDMMNRIYDFIMKHKYMEG